MCMLLLFIWIWSMGTCSLIVTDERYIPPHFDRIPHNPPLLYPPVHWSDFGRGPKFVFVAPAVLAEGRDENILLEAFDVTEPLNVTLSVYNYPAQLSQRLLEEIIPLNADNNYSSLKTIRIPPRVPFRRLSEIKMVQLLAVFGEHQRIQYISKVSVLSGYVFIQTDKPIYNPGDTVHFRAFVSTPEFQAFNSTIMVEIQNADGVTVHVVPKVRAENGVYSDTYLLPDIVREGKWEIVAKFVESSKKTYSANFEVKKYELPAFNVTLIPKKYYLSLDDEELEVNIYAKYMYGEKVDGFAYVVFGVENDGVKVRVSSMKQVKNLDGGNATLTVAELKQVYPDANNLGGLSIYIKASVMTSTGSDLVEAEKSGIKIISSPYVLTIEDTSMFYRSGLPFDLTVKVSHHDGSPAPNIPVKIRYLSTPVTKHSGTVRVSINMPGGHSRKRIKVKTVDPELKPAQQAQIQWLVDAYMPAKILEPNQLYITVNKKEAKIGETLDFQLHLSISSESQTSNQEPASYIVLNKGKIIRTGRLNLTEDEETTVPLLITSEMVPAFRFVAYYIWKWPLTVEVMSDSVSVKVESQCLGSLNLEPLSGESKDSFSPGDSFGFQLRGDPGAKVSLVAVDNSLFLLSKSRLTQTQIWETLGEGDLGCSPGGGMDSMSVFVDAGLNFQSSFHISSNTPPCHWKLHRYRRDVEKMQLRENLEKSHSDRFLQRCCSDGMREIPMPYSCRRRALYITENWSCVKAFLECCSKYRGEELGVITPPPLTTAEPTVPTMGHLPTHQYGYVGVGHPVPGVIPGMGRPPDAGGFVGAVGYGGGVPAVGAGHVVGYGGGVPAAGYGGGVPAAGYGGGVPAVGYGGGVPAVGYGGGVPAVGYGGVGGVPEFGAGPGAGIGGMVYLTSGREGFPAPALSDEYYDKLDDIYVRTKFFESWLWTDVQLPEAPGPDGKAVAPVESVLPDSITQWGILGISASSRTGFCVAEPFNIRAWKPFFIDLRLPRTAARNEHVEVKAVLHNYMSKDLKVLVIMAKTEDLCSVAFTTDHKQEVFVKAQSSVLISYTVIPLRAGELTLQVTAVSQSVTGRDAVRKTLRVVVEGIQKMVVRSFVLDPSEKGDDDGNQLIRVDKAKLSLVVPNSVPETFVNVRGNLLADSIDNSINKDSLAALIRMPGGCVEQNLAAITLPLIAAHYLDRSSQWESVGLHRREEALRYIRQGYENQLHYRKTDDSYPPYRNEGTSTWITAFVVKVFSMVYPFITVNKQHICGPLLYLLKHKQLGSGAFKEDNPVYATSMTGGLQGAESRETLTAFVLIALAEAQHVVTCSDLEINTEVRFRRAGDYLKEQHKRLRRPYSVAIACYALAVSGQGCSKSVLLKSSSPVRTHWPDADNSFFTLEATGYALLALLKGGHFEEAAAPFKWLNQQRRVGGGYGSTQSTMVVLQALSEYLVKKPNPADTSLQVDLSVPGRSDIRWSFTNQISHLARSSRVPLDQDFSVLATGNGQGILEVVTVYNELPDEHEKSSCNGFDLNVSISESNEKPPADVEKVYTLHIEVKALGHQVRMAVLDISLPTGFEPDTSDLELLTNSVDRYINNYQIVDNLSDRGSLIIHLFKVSNREADMITFRLNQKFKVGLLQPSTVTVYQYYNTDKRCSRFYTPPEDKEQLGQICKGNICRCTQGDCCVLKTAGEMSTERKQAACSGIHYAYKVRVLNVSKSQYDRYEVEILQVIKEGSEVGVKEGNRQVFVSHAGCRAGLDLLTGQDYLIVGPPSDVWQAGSDENGYTYTLGKRTWVEHWPSSPDCTAAAPDRCTQLEEFTVNLRDFGCQT